MLDLNDGARASLRRAKALGMDSDGREIFVGLTRAESERYHSLSNPAWRCSLSEHLEFLQLDSRHLQAHSLNCAKSPLTEESQALMQQVQL
jgi:hypothetical protein